MPANRRKKITINILIPFFIVVLFFSVMMWLKYQSSHNIPVIPPPSSAESVRSVILFFTVDGTRLAREARDLEPCDSDAACVKSVLDELLNGPVGELEEAVPEGSVVSSVMLEGEQATIEFNRMFSDSMLSGSAAEMLAVYSVVNTITINFPQVHKVKINIDGNKAAILRHLDISDPLLPDYSLEQPPPGTTR